MAGAGLFSVPTRVANRSANFTSNSSHLVRARPTAANVISSESSPIAGGGGMSQGLAMVKKPDLDEPTRKIAQRMLSMPPKRHERMKIGKAKTPPRKKGTSRP